MLCASSYLDITISLTVIYMSTIVSSIHVILLFISYFLSIVSGVHVLVPIFSFSDIPQYGLSLLTPFVLPCFKMFYSLPFTVSIFIYFCNGLILSLRISYISFKTILLSLSCSSTMLQTQGLL